jgi:hypothetical protein
LIVYNGKFNKNSELIYFVNKLKQN